MASSSPLRRRFKICRLEDRCVPATFLVNALGDAGTGAGTSGDLRYCLTQANSMPGADTVNFDSTLFATTKTIDISAGGTLQILDAVNIQGPGTDKVAFSGGGKVQVINIDVPGAGGAVAISDLTIRDGFTDTFLNTSGVAIDDDAVTLTKVALTENINAVYGGALTVTGDAAVNLVDSSVTGNSGVGVFAYAGYGTINVTRCTITGNAQGLSFNNDFYGKATIDATTISGNQFDGIDLFGVGAGEVTLTNSTISGNQGPGIFAANACILNVLNSTIANNVNNSPYSYFYPGGGIAAQLYAQVTISNSTISGNTSKFGAGGVAVAYDYGMTIDVSSTIIAGNSSDSGLDISSDNGFIFGGDYNLVGVYDPTICTLSGTHNKTGTLAAPLNPLFAPLGKYGGPTQTMALLPGSPAINAGAANGLTTDQRGVGFPRAIGAMADIGAFETADKSPAVQVSAANVTAPGGTSFTVTITYVDETGINLSTIDLNDITVSGGGFATPAKPTMLSTSGSGTKVTAVYTFTPPGGSWDLADVGAYSINLGANEVFDTDGPNAAPAGKIGSFRVILPVTFVVDLASDEDNGNTSKGDLSLREAIRLANENAGGFDTITFDPGVFSTKQTINISTLGKLRVTDAVTITGPGADLLTIDGGGKTRVIEVNIPGSADQNVAISDLRVTGGFDSVGAGVTMVDEDLTLSNVVVDHNQASNGGGGVSTLGKSGSLTILHSTVSDNTCGGAVSGGGILILNAGAILTIRDCMIANNTVTEPGGAAGGGLFLYHGGVVLAENTTWVGNAASTGGAIASYFGPAEITLTNNTLTGNNAGAVVMLSPTQGNGLTISNSTITGNTGGAIYGQVGQVITLNSTIVAGNSGADFFSPPGYVLNADHSLIGIVDTAVFTVNGNDNLTGTPAAPLNPQLLPLGDYGGPTKTHALSAFSPALNKGSNPLALSFDQRGPGFPRVLGGQADIGASEGVGVIPGGFGSLLNLTSAGVFDYLFTVDWVDDMGIDIASIGTGDVTLTGPNGLVATPTLVSTKGSGQKVTATYSFSPPGGSWDITDNGDYTFTVNANQVFDTDATPHANVASTLGSFRVGIVGTIAVDTAADENDGNYSKGDFSLREAIGLTRFSIGGASSVTFDPIVFGTPQTIDVATLGSLFISNSVAIAGPGSDLLTVSGGDKQRVFMVNDGKAASIEVSISGLTIADGFSGNYSSGAIFASNETLTLDKVWVTGCNTDFRGGAIGISSGKLTIRDSTLSGNAAKWGAGALYAVGSAQVLLVNSTVSGNTSAGTYGTAGGGVVGYSLTSAAKFTIQNSTITDNHSGTKGGGGGVAITAAQTNGITTIDIESSIIAGNTTPDGEAPDIRTGAGTIAVNAKNCLIGVADSGFVLNDLGGNFTGTKVAPLDPLLWPLARYGGKVPTHALKAGSVALNHGSNPSGLSFDARGFARQSGAAVDIGAYESAPPTVIATTVNDGSAQRSRVNAITVTFSEPVELSAGAFTLERTSGGPTGSVNVNVSQSGNAVTLTFAAGGTVGVDPGGSLADGRYQLAMSAASIHGAVGTLDGNNDGVGGDDRMFLTHRLFGDSNGDGIVNSIDFAALRNVYGVASMAFDFDNNGAVSSLDFNAFRLRYGVSI